MAKISLRAYNHEIGKLIDHGQTEEASAHCKYILKIFPKHLDTYRLLGKTYLESQRYSEAADILQRVLAVVPDDFVSQIGLSIIREDEGNLDAAIWNMERAFEVQPSNAAVQEELRRLYGNRDGVQPPRVRLTRGALVRMYTKGNLYQQAIAEARAAIAESPKRTDLEILLARNYFLSKNFVEATEICSRLVKKMPYCYEANLILAEILPKTNKSEEAKIFAKRVQELDPYAAFIDRSATTSAQVPDDAVTLEKLDWQPSMEDAEQPRWAKSIGVDIGTQSDEPSTDWLSDMPEGSPESSAPMPFIIPEISSTQSDESLPGWMKEDEWSAGKETDTPGEKQPTSAFIMDDEDELQEANIPEWLQTMAPDEIDQGQQAASPQLSDIPAAEASDAPEWMNGLDVSETPADIAKPASDTPFLPEASAEEDVPEWMQNMNASEEIEEAPAEPASPPQSDITASETIEDSSLAVESPEEEDMPDWLKDLETSASGSGEATSVGEDVQPGVTDMLGKPAQEPEVPDWLNDIEQGEAVKDSSELPSAEPTDEVPDWLQNLEGSDIKNVEASPLPEQEHLITTDTPINAPLTDDVPDWLSDMQQNTAADETPGSVQPDLQGEDSPDWLQNFESDSGETAEDSLTPEEIQPGVTDMLGKPSQEPETPDWLSDIAHEETAPETTEQASTTIPADELPDWLQDLEGTDSPSGEQNDLPDTPAPGITDMLGKPTEEPDIPDWLTDIDSVTDNEGESEDIVPTDTSEKQPTTKAPQASDQMPDWLQEFDSPDSSAEIERELPPSLEDSLATSDDLPELLQPDEKLPDLEAVLPAAALGASQLLNDAEAQSEDTSPQESGEMPEDPDEAFAWLESLAAHQGADEEALSTPVEERDTATPDWLQELGQAVPASQSESESQLDINEDPKDSEPAPDETVSTESLPDWLQDLDQSATEPQNDQESKPLEHEAFQNAETGGKFTNWLNGLDDNNPPAEQSISLQQDQELPQGGDAAQLPAETEESTPDLLQLPSDNVPAEFEREASVASDNKESHPADIPDDKQPDDNVSVPDWLNELAEEDTSEHPPHETQEAAQASQVDLPDWMTSNDGNAEELAPAAKSASIPDWLEELKPADSVPTAEGPTAETKPETSKEVERPDSMTNTVSPEDETLALSDIVHEEAKPAESEEMPVDADDAFAWLESLAAKHGAEEEALVTASEERQETPPDWVQDLETEKEVKPEEFIWNRNLVHQRSGYWR